MASADFVVVPSRFEPCGLVAQAGVRYGAVPIVCAVGGLKDLVTPEVSSALFAVGLGVRWLAFHVERCIECDSPHGPHLLSHAHLCSCRRLRDLQPPRPPHLQVGYTLPGFSHEGTAADHRQNVQQLLAAVRQAAAEYSTPRYRAMQQHCMALDVSWERPAAEWEQLLQQVAAQHPVARTQAA